MGKPKPTIDCRNHNKKKDGDDPAEINIERSVLDIRKIYPEKSLDAFARMYNTKYRISSVKVKRILEAQELILQTRKQFTLLTDLEFIGMFNKQHPEIKKSLVAMVLKDYEKE